MYCLLAIAPVMAVMVFVLSYAWWGGLYTLGILFFCVLYATVRYGAFLQFKRTQWLLAVLLIFAGYLPSYIFVLYRSIKYYRNPPPPPRRRVEDDPDYHPRGTSVVLDWSEPHGSGGGS
ncbi:MAG: hypothetical protein ACYC99_08775 [Candidatus Geothermincolia bacterium]